LISNGLSRRTAKTGVTPKTIQSKGNLVLTASYLRGIVLIGNLCGLPGNAKILVGVFSFPAAFMSC